MYQDVDPEIASLLFEVKKNQLKMIRRRGYNIDSEKAILGLTLSQFLQTYIPFAQKQNKSFRAVLTNVYQNDQGKKILVYYVDVPPSSTQLGTKEVSAAIADMDKYNLHDAVIITTKQLSASANKNIESLVSYNIQIFLEKEMAYDPTEHFLVPEHIPLSEEEARLFLEKNNLSLDQLPVIRSDDIIMRNLGMRGGRIVKIVRENMFETMILKSVSYKAVKE